MRRAPLQAFSCIHLAHSGPCEVGVSLPPSYRHRNWGGQRSQVASSLSSCSWRWKSGFTWSHLSELPKVSFGRSGGSGSLINGKAFCKLSRAMDTVECQPTPPLERGSPPQQSAWHCNDWLNPWALWGKGSTWSTTQDRQMCPSSTCLHWVTPRVPVSCFFLPPRLILLPKRD